VDLFERIEGFFRRLEAYIDVPSNAGMTDTIVKIMVEVLLILAIVTKEIKRNKASKLKLPFSGQRLGSRLLLKFRKVFEEVGGQNGYGGCSAEAGEIDARGSSDGCCARFESHTWRRSRSSRCQS
jgi:hypothetical protein